MKPVIIITIAFVFLLIPINAYAQSNSILTFDSIPTNAQIGNTIYFSGNLHRADGSPISGETIQINSESKNILNQRKIEQNLSLTNCNIHR